MNVTFEDRIIVGAAASVKVRGLERISEPQVYLGHQQIIEGGLSRRIALRFDARLPSPQ